MHTPVSNIYDAIIAGAGPVGLFLACELRLAGCSVLILEKAPDPHSPLKGLPFGLRGLTVPTIESLDRRDLLDALTARAVSRDAPAAAHWMDGNAVPVDTSPASSSSTTGSTVQNGPIACLVR